MNIEQEQNYFIIIGKYLSGEASPEEAMLFHQWIEDPKNKSEYQRILSLWNRMHSSADVTELNVMQAWKDLQTALASTPRSQPGLKPLYRYLIAASVTALVITTGIIWFNSRKSKLVEKIAQVSLVKEAKNDITAAVMPDSSRITINRNSSVEYYNDFNMHGRSMVLKGEAFFDVAHNAAKPFEIAVGDLKILVIGTSFNIKSDSTQQLVEVQVVTGVVKMYTQSKELIVSAGETGIYQLPGGLLSLRRSIDINSVSYATRNFSFQDLSMVEVRSYLEDAFGVVIEFDEARFRDCRITAEFSDKPLPYILDVVNATLNTTYKQEGKIIHIEGQGCL